MSEPPNPPPAQLFVVRNRHGGAFDGSRPLREQPEWPAHAAFMNQLVDDGIVLIGGPLEGDRETLLIARGPREVLQARLEADPWIRNGMLQQVSMESLQVFLSPPWVDAGLA